MSELAAPSAAAVAPAATPPADKSAPAFDRLPSLDMSSRANSGNSVLSQGSTSGASEQAAQLVSLGSGLGSAELESGSSSADRSSSGGTAATAAAFGQPAGTGAQPVRKDDAKSSALKALAGVSAIVSKSRKVDAEALQAIKSQRAKARAEGHPPSGPGPAVTRGSTPPPPGPGGPGPDSGPGVSPFASATSQGLVRTPSASNLASALHGTPVLAQSASLPISMSGHSRPRRSPVGTPPGPSPVAAAVSALDYESMVSKMTITELVALKQAVESQLAKQAMALMQLQASSHSSPAQPDMLSQQYAALLLQNAQQAQLVQQLSSQQQAAHAAAIQQALSAAAAAAGITSPSFSPEQLLLSAAAQAATPGGGAGAPGGPAGPAAAAAAAASLSQYGGLSMHGPPPPEMSSPFASATYPPDTGFGLPEAGSHGPSGRGGLQPPGAPNAPGGPGRPGGAPGVPGGGAASSKSSGSPRSASAEQQLIGEALHSFVDPERQGPPSRQGSALVNGINWSDRRTSGPAALGPPPRSFVRSHSLPHPPDGLYHDRAAALSTYLGEGDQQLPSLFNTLRMDSLASGEVPAGPAAAAFSAARGGSLQVPMQRVSFSDSVQTRTFQQGY